jgi:hypothetical protein
MANEHEWDEEDYFSNPSIQDVMGEMLSNTEYQWDSTYEVTNIGDCFVVAELVIQNTKYILTLSLADENEN